MKNAHPQKKEVSALEQAHSNPSSFQQELFDLHCTGTSAGFNPSNLRHRRVALRLLKGGLWRLQVDAIAGAANGPELMANIGIRNVHWTCRRIPVIDQDGCECKPGFYELTPLGREILQVRLAKTVRKEASHDGDD